MSPLATQRWFVTIDHEEATTVQQVNRFRHPGQELYILPSRNVVAFWSSTVMTITIQERAALCMKYRRSSRDDATVCKPKFPNIFCVPLRLQATECQPPRERHAVSVCPTQLG